MKVIYKKFNLTFRTILKICFKNLKNSDKDCKTLDEIEMDIHRTFPDNTFFKEEKEDRKKLYNILVAYSEFNKGIGYCQGLNYVAGKVFYIFIINVKFFIYDIFAEILFSIMNLLKV